MFFNEGKWRYLEVFLNFRGRNDIGIGVIDPFTAFCGFFPGFCGGELLWPPGECTALFGSCGIDLAAVAFEKNTVEVFFVFNERKAIEYLPGVAFEEFFSWKLKVFAEIYDIFFAKPNKTWATSAAISAAGAFEIESLFIPRIFHSSP